MLPPRSRLQSGRAGPFDEVLLKDDEDHENRQEGHGSHREDGASIGGGHRIGEHAKRERDSEDRGRVQVGQGTEKVVASPVEAEDRRRDQGRGDEWKDDARKDTKHAATVEVGGLVSRAFHRGSREGPHFVFGVLSAERKAASCSKLVSHPRQVLVHTSGEASPTWWRVMRVPPATGSRR